MHFQLFFVILCQNDVHGMKTFSFLEQESRCVCVVDQARIPDGAV
jgi:hypothetical protein